MNPKGLCDRSRPADAPGNESGIAAMTIRGWENDLSSQDDDKEDQHHGDKQGSGAAGFRYSAHKTRATQPPLRLTEGTLEAFELAPHSIRY